MKILAIDTASDVCGISLLENATLIDQFDILTGRTHSENLMPMIEKAFQKNKLSLKDIGLLVCDKGPGSFTGIRIGIATVKAFHDSLLLPCIGISSLEVLSYYVKQDGFIASMIDCKNNNCYYALYELQNGNYYEKIAPTANTIDVTLSTLQDYSSSFTFVGDGAVTYASLISKTFPDSIILENSITLNSYFLGLAGFKKFQANSYLGEDILPFYLRKPQAQRQLEEKEKGVLEK